jgi:hypothetical protein
MCYALSVAGVTDALSGYSRRCFKRHACVPDTFLYIPIQCVYMTSALSALSLTSLEHGHKRESAAGTIRYNVQTQTFKPVITTDSMVSSRELIAAGHAVPGPHDAGVLGSGQALSDTSHGSLMRTT